MFDYTQITHYKVDVAHDIQHMADDTLRTYLHVMCMQMFMYIYILNVQLFHIFLLASSSPCLS